MASKAFELRPHQRAAVKCAKTVYDGGRKSGLWAMPTGTGKTFAFLDFARQVDGNTLVLVHRDELVMQTLKAARTVWPQASQGVIQADVNEWTAKLVVASVQSLHTARLEKLSRNQFHTIITDEAHHYSGENSWSRPLDWFDYRFLLGVTATPERHDGQGLDRYFGESPIYTYALRRAIQDGWLVDLKQFGIETGINLDGVHKRRGDFVISELSNAVNTPERNKVCVEAYQKHAEGRRAIVFAVDREHIKDLTQEFRDAGIGAGWVDGTLSKRDRRKELADFAAGRFQIMTACEVLTEGFDDPGVSTVIMARPSGSRPWYTQAVGRGLRLCPDEGKTDCLVLDITDNSQRHKLITAMSLVGKPESSDLSDAAGESVITAVDEEIAELERCALIKTVHPLEWRVKERSPWPEKPSLEGYTGTAPWHEEDASAKQVKFIRSFGLTVERDLSKGEAGWLIDQCLEYDAAHPEPATIGQVKYLQRRNALTEAEAIYLTKREAKRMIAALERDAPAMATPGQIKYLRYLRALPPDSDKLTSREASRLIGKAKRELKKRQGGGDS